MSQRNNLLAFVVVAVAAMGVALAILAPYVGAEYLLRQHGATVLPPPRQPIQGHWYGDYFLVENIDATTFAIGEPRYYQGNYSYLLLGSSRALTSLPVTVIPSHLHFDHVGALGRFERTALIDLPSLRARAASGKIHLQRYEFLGMGDSLPEPRFAVDEWWLPGATVDLGGRRVQLLSTPGHTPTSVALHDADRRQLFAGDFIYPSTLYAFLPGSSRSAYLATTRRLLATLNPATQIYAAHMTDDPKIIAAPVLGMADLRALEATLAAIAVGDAKSSGFYPRVYPVRGAITFATGFAWNNR